jgi:hypothetical protein
VAAREPAKGPTVQSLAEGLRNLERRHEQATNVPTEAQEREKLISALKGAVGIEFATIPPYLTALWSIKDDLHPMAVSLRNIVQEEMLHLALASNLLAAIGGTPRFNVGNPTYPTKLPLGVHPKLTVTLQGLSPGALDLFLAIERPDNPDYKQWLTGASDVDVDGAQGSDFTIGMFYDQIQHAFHRLNPVLSTDHQMSGPLAWMVVKNLDDVDEAIGIIKHQGEGSWGSPDEGHDDHLAHFFRFAEMKVGKKLVRDSKTGQWSFATPITFDLGRDVWPVGEVPAGGYSGISDPEVCRLLRGFNLAYSKLLDFFQAAWSQPGGQAMLVHAIAVMFELPEFTTPLMRIQRPDDDKNYGPEFRYIPAKER